LDSDCPVLEAFSAGSVRRCTGIFGGFNRRHGHADINVNREIATRKGSHLPSSGVLRVMVDLGNILTLNVSTCQMQI
jgi:hypothetical protein